MAKAYSTVGSDHGGAVPQTLISLTGGTTVRMRLFEFLCGCVSAPADVAYQVAVKRSTAAGTGTAVTPQALDSADVAALVTALQNLTVEPTYTPGVTLLQQDVNQRMAWRWVCARDGAEFVSPATAANGLGLVRVANSQALTLDATTFHYE